MGGLVNQSNGVSQDVNGNESPEKMEEELKKSTRKKVVVVGLGMVGIAFMYDAACC